MVETNKFKVVMPEVKHQHSTTERKLAAIMFTDIVGYTALMGESEEKALEIRRRNREIHLQKIEKLRALTQLTREITLQRGRPDDQYVEQFFQVGYGKQALVELVAYVGLMTFNNYLNNLTDVPVDFPKAKSLKEAA